MNDTKYMRAAERLRDGVGVWALKQDKLWVGSLRIRGYINRRPEHLHVGHGDDAFLQEREMCESRVAGHHLANTVHACMHRDTTLR
jgi:hypothetical protein